MVTGTGLVRFSRKELGAIVLVSLIVSQYGLLMCQGKRIEAILHGQNQSRLFTDVSHLPSRSSATGASVGPAQDQPAQSVSQPGHPSQPSQPSRPLLTITFKLIIVPGPSQFPAEGIRCLALV